MNSSPLPRLVRHGPRTPENTQRYVKFKLLKCHGNCFGCTVFVEFRVVITQLHTSYGIRIVQFLLTERINMM